MKISDQPTSYVILKAGTKCDWDPCDFALLHLCPAWAFIMRRRLAVVAPFRDDETFYSHVYWDEPLGYFISHPGSETRKTLSKMAKRGITWCYVTLDFPEEFALLDVPENRLDTHMLMINSDGDASYMCFAKNSGEEYSTAGFSLKKILRGLDK